MVVPVPVVLQKEDVKTLPRDVFAHVDALGAPRLVEYWEQDPCSRRRPRYDRRWRGVGAGRCAMPDDDGGRASDLGVKIEAQFTVGEYEIVILSREGLDRPRHLAAPGDSYKIPDGRRAAAAAVRRGRHEVLRREGRPEEGHVRRRHGRRCRRCASTTTARSSRCRSGSASRTRSGTQDLIVNILAPRPALRGRELQERHDPDEPRRRPTRCATQLRRVLRGAVRPDAREEPGRGRHRVRVADAATCDPCPGPHARSRTTSSTLGADVLPAEAPGTRGSPSRRGRRGPCVAGHRVDGAAGHRSAR